MVQPRVDPACRNFKASFQAPSEVKALCLYTIQAALSHEPIHKVFETKSIHEVIELKSRRRLESVIDDVSQSQAWI